MQPAAAAPCAPPAAPPTLSPLRIAAPAKGASIQEPLQPDSATPGGVKALHVSAHLAASPLAGTPQRRPPCSPAAPPGCSAKCPSPDATHPPSWSPSPRAQLLQFARDLPHELAGHERPGVVSRFPHHLAALRCMRAELQSELQVELDADLAAQGLDPGSCQGLTREQVAACMGEVQWRRTEARKGLSSADRRRADYMGNTVRWHVDQVARSQAGAPSSSARSRPTPPTPTGELPCVNLVTCLIDCAAWL